jgi:predicted PurR-regulated permease PerM
MLAYILVPGVEAIAGRLGVRRALVVIVLYVVLVLALGLGVAVLEPVLVRDTQDLVQNGPAIVESLLQQTVGTGEIQVLGATVDAKTLAARLLTAARDALGRPTEALHLAEGVIRGVFDTFLVLIVLFYLLRTGSGLLNSPSASCQPAAGRTWAGWRRAFMPSWVATFAGSSTW